MPGCQRLMLEAMPIQMPQPYAAAIQYTPNLILSEVLPLPPPLLDLALERPKRVLDNHKQSVYVGAYGVLSLRRHVVDGEDVRVGVDLAHFELHLELHELFIGVGAELFEEELPAGVLLLQEGAAVVGLHDPEVLPEMAVILTRITTTHYKCLFNVHGADSLHASSFSNSFWEHCSHVDQTSFM